jgi:transposase
VLLVLDQAGYHLSGRVRKAMQALSITPMWLPAYSPELQPSERLWQPLDAPLANRTFDSIDELDEAVGKQCIRLTEQPERIRSMTLYHWWPGGADHEPDP